MSQVQKGIPLLRIDGTGGLAARTGNNAAWLCSCGRDVPVLGYSDTPDSRSSASMVACPACSRQFRVLSSKKRGSAEQVQELKGPG